MSTFGNRLTKAFLASVLALSFVPFSAWADPSGTRFDDGEFIRGVDVPLYDDDQFVGLTDDEVNEIIGRPDSTSLNYVWETPSASENNPEPYSLGEGTVGDMLSIVAGQSEGVPEGGDYNKYNNFSGEPWCAYFISWCARQAGVSSSVIPNIYECSRLESYYRNLGAWHSYSYTPKVGDLVFYSASSGGTSIHVGIVTKVENGTVYTKEGNNTGGKIAVHERPVGTSWIWYGWYIKGYATPNYASHQHSFLKSSMPQDDYRHRSSYDFCGCGALKADELEECVYEWSGLSLVCKDCGQEYVPHEAGDYVVTADQAALFELSDSTSETLATMPKNTVLSVGHAQLDASGRYMAPAEYEGHSGYVLMGDLIPNGSAGVHDYLNGVCRLCGTLQVASQPGVYAVDSSVTLYKGNVLDLNQKTKKPGEAVAVSRVEPTTMGYLWGYTPDGYVVDMGNLTKRTSDAVINRIAGESASQTSVAISEAAFAQDGKSEWVVIARDDDFADAMSATGLAGVLECPILLTGRNELSSDVALEIKRLGATKAYIIGGTGAITATMENQLQLVGVMHVERVWGETCWDTSAACARKIAEIGKGSEDVIVAMSMNFQDALSISSFAYAYGVPILLQTNDDYGRCLSNEAVEFIQAREGLIYVPGGPGAVRLESVEGVFGSDRVVRLYGQDGYDTSNQIAHYMVNNGLLNPDFVVVASGAQAPGGRDALAGSALAGQAKGVLILANENEAIESVNLTTVNGVDSEESAGYLIESSEVVKTVVLLGGTYVMPNDVIDVITNTLLQGVWSRPTL